jgi:hypothetical protein
LFGLDTSTPDKMEPVYNELGERGDVMNTEEVDQLRQDYLNGERVTALAKTYGISVSYCSRLVRNLVRCDLSYDYTTRKSAIDARLVFNLRNQGLTYREIAERTATKRKRYTESGLAYIYNRINEAVKRDRGVTAL